ncbi:CopG family transcriptional regulator [Roseofilum sp. BLCC_M154]|uniref:CopG family transcriptional regulator n=1 Tax=Roseofilum acuticapitatum BLCC-M154 TaxID=3022444 RepID=A0ABT7ASH7_9CYAN|nr:CopG family transcriptional regulator [Roseofilum acuticapitatum]MDJ1169863.1 CopG family transcriptional regulator [Roseofilum acuticapitatum BLCC-M154]
MNSYFLQLPDEVLKEIKRLAEENQVSMDRWLLSAITEKIEAQRTVHLLESYAKQADYSRFDKILDKIPNAEPLPGDELSMNNEK